jgi:transposase
MIDYETYCKIRQFHQERGLNFSQIGGELGLDPETVAKYARLSAFPRRRSARRASKLEPFKAAITRWLERHPYSATQIFQRLRDEESYTGGFGIVKAYVRAVRPVRRPAFLSLAFAPGEAAQVDWGCAGTIQLGATRRRLSFFVMVLCHSRMAYVEFTCGEAMEHFLACHHNALEFFGATPGVILIDNLKTGVLSHPFGEQAVFHPRYLDFAAHYGFQPRACNVRKANEKGRVENFVGYVKKNFLAGLEVPPGLAAINTAVLQWLATIANVRCHGETRQPPAALFTTIDKPALRPLPPLPPDTSVTRTVRVTNRCRIVLDTNRYSVPSLYASQRLTLKAFSDRICLYHCHNLIATHPRSYERHRDFENPDHVKELLDQRRRARDAKWLLSFYALSPQAESYHQQLCARNLNARVHVNKIVALADIYGPDKVALAIDDAIASHAYSSQYIENILQQRQRHTPQPGPLHLTRRADLLELELTAPDLTPYYSQEQDQTNKHTDQPDQQLTDQPDKAPETHTPDNNPQT